MKTRILLAGFAMLSLGGCGSIFPHNVARTDLTEVKLDDYFAQRLADGKRLLRAGLPTAAITAFRQASYDPRYAGEAYNGMAIAYDSLGRSDVAGRMFRLAMEKNADDPRFARNLARFEAKGLPVPQAEERFAGADIQPGVAQAAVAAPVAPTAEPAPVRLEGGAGTLKFEGNRVIRIGDSEGANGAAIRSGKSIAVGSISVATAPRTRQPVKTVAVSSDPYPVRVALSAEAPRKPSTYPVRVALSAEGK